jgi:LDH2 family malate/lactate/ureidoglycolate dehydrogenase
MTVTHSDREEVAPEITIEASKVRQFGMDVLSQLGVPVEKGDICVEAFLFGSLRGIDTHGFFALLPRLVREIRAGMVEPGADIRIVRREPSTLLMDGCSGPGPVTAYQSMKEAMRLGRENGIGGVSTYNCNHFGAASFYGLQAVGADMIGLTFSNATPRVVPYGGRQGVHGTNPVSFAIPAHKYPPLVVDIATSASSAGKISKALKKGERIPEGWALDQEGNPTTDPEKALRGFLLPMADHKGYGLGLVVDILTGALAGSFCGKGVPPLEDLTTPYGGSYFMLVLNPACFAGIDIFKEKVDRLIEDCITCPPMEGFERVYFPGELEAMEEAKRSGAGIPVRESELAKFFEAMRDYDLEVREDILV